MESTLTLYDAMGNRESGRAESTPLSENTTVRLSLLLLIVGMLATGLVGGVWWAANIGAKVDYLTVAVSAEKASNETSALTVQSLRMQMQDYEWRLKALEGKNPK